jgi:hypothetical protein
MGVAAPVLALGGFAALGAASAAACLLGAAVGASLPEHRGDRDPEDGDAPSYGALLRAGVTEARSAPAVRAAVLLVPAVTAIWGSLDEYLPLLAVEAGATTADVPLLGLLVYAGVAAGGLAAGAASRLPSRRLALVVLMAAAALAAGAATGVVAGFVLIAVSFAGFQALTVAADARLQDAIGGEARSTITSLAGLATEVAVLGIFALYAAGSQVADHATLFVAFAALHLVVAAWLTRRSRTPS